MKWHNIINLPKSIVKSMGYICPTKYGNRWGSNFNFWYIGNVLEKKEEINIEYRYGSGDKKVHECKMANIHGEMYKPAVELQLSWCNDWQEFGIV